VTEVSRVHPGPDRLLAFRLGRLAEQENADITAHLAQCETCRALAQALNPDTLLSVLQTPAPPAPTESVATPADAETLAPDTVPLPIDPGIPPELADHPRYRILGLLGSGGMGRVYKAEHRLMERLVALKVINRNLTDNAAAVERFRREVKTAAKLSHPNIVTAFDAEQVGDWHFLVMEYVEGQSLDRIVQARGRLPIADACDYMRQAALGLQHAWERGMVHRDIKPHNLMLTPQGQIKILDFGLARFLSEGKPITALTQFGVIMGTPDYIAPEQAQDSRTADIRADLYSLGCTFFYLLTGRVPFPDGSLLQKLMAQVTQEATPLRVLREDAPTAVIAILARLMAKDPARRYQTPSEAAQVLASWKDQAGAESTALGPSPELAPLALSADTSPNLQHDDLHTSPLDVLPVAPDEVDDPTTRRLSVLPAEETNDVPAPKYSAEKERSLAALANNFAWISLILGICSLPVGCLACFVGGIPLSSVGFLLGAASLGITIMAKRRAAGGRQVPWLELFDITERRVGLPLLGMGLSAVAFATSLLLAVLSVPFRSSGDSKPGIHWNFTETKSAGMEKTK
jgi:serine/threonine protein kinase